MTKRFPRKAKKWAKKNNVKLVSVHGKTVWYAHTVTSFQLKW